MFNDEKTVSFKEIESGIILEYLPSVRLLRCPDSATLINEEPEIPPCQMSKAEYPAAPINP